MARVVEEARVGETTQKVADIRPAPNSAPGRSRVFVPFAPATSFALAIIDMVLVFR